LLNIRRMTAPEVSFAVDLAYREGLNPGLHDAVCFAATDSNGFFLAEVAGEPVACLAALALDNSLGHLGLHIVKPSFRGKGLGKLLLQRGLEYLGKRSIGLNCPRPRQEYYRQFGFQPSFTIRRSVGIGVGGEVSPRVTSLRELPFKDLLTYDQNIFAASRPDFLKHWLEQDDSVALGIQDRGRTVGYGVLRKCRLGYRLGPLFANTAAAAATLYDSLTAGIAGQPVFLDLPEVNTAALALAEQRGLSVVIDAVRMYANKEPAAPIGRIFGITALEIG